MNNEDTSGRRVDGNDLSQFRHALAAQWHRGTKIERFGSLMCGACREVRAVDLHWYGATSLFRDDDGESHMFQLPGLAVFECRQCRAHYPAAVSSKADPLIRLFGSPASLVTPATPPGVAYYLEQAAAAKGAQARSAAAAMFRSALEHLMIDQDYERGNLNDKIEALAADIEAKKADLKPWALQIGPRVLHAIREIGNHAVHANDGDIEKQKLLDDETLDLIEVVFVRLLRAVYEDPAADQKIDKDLQEAAAKMKDRRAKANP